MKGSLGVALGCALGAVEAKVVKWGRDVHERSWSPPQQTLGVMPELFNAPPLPTPAPLVPKRALEKRGATDNTCAFVGGTFERSLYCDTTAYCASNSLNSHVGCCDDTRSSSCTVWTTCLAMSESAKYTTNNGLTLWCGFSDYPNCITHIYADSTSKASALKGYTLLGCAVAQGSDKVYYNAFTQTKVTSTSGKISLTPNNPSTTTVPEAPAIPKNTAPPNDPNGGGGIVVSKITTYYDVITSNGVVYTTAIATSTVPASGATSGGSGSSSTTKPKSTPIGAIAGGVVGGVAAISLIAFALWYLMRRKKPEADVPSPPPPQPTIPVMVQQAPPPPANGYYGRESIAKPPFDSLSTPSQSPPPPQSPISPYTGSTPSPPLAGGQHASMYGAAALGAAGGFAAAGQYGQQQQQQGYGRQSQQYQGYQNQPPQQYQQDQGPSSPVSQQYSDQGYQNQPPQQYQNQPTPPQQQYQNQPPPPQQYQSQSPPPPQQQQYQNQPPPAGYGYQQQQRQQEYDQYPTPHHQQPVYTQGGYAPPPGQRGVVSELPIQRGDGEVRELQG